MWVGKFLKTVTYQRMTPAASIGVGEVTARRELYRRLARIGEVVVDVAERVWYTVVREG